MTFCQFLSTPSARRATGRRSAATGHPPDFYPRPPQGGRRFSGLCLDLRIDISIHALRKEGDRQRRTAYESESISIHALRKEGDFQFEFDGALLQLFLSTPSARRATSGIFGFAVWLIISIHALRKEGDPRNSPPSGRAGHFYPRPPQGGRRPSRLRLATGAYFYPRPPQGGRLSVRLQALDSCVISIHALRKEGDWQAGSAQVQLRYFYPRPPQGGRRIRNHITGFFWQFLSTPSARRATAKTEKNISAFVSL